MELGIFSKVFKKYPVEEAFKRINKLGLKSVQFNFANMGIESLPMEIDQKMIDEIKRARISTGTEIPIISGTFNTLELDKEKYLKNMKGFKTVVNAASELGITFISISTGSFNQNDFWSPHPDNHTEKGWNRLYQSLDEMLEIVTEKNMVIVIEPEQSNVVSTVDDIVRLFSHYDNTSHLKVLFDAANIVTKEDATNLKGKIFSALKDLGEDIGIAHCKDCLVTKEEVQFMPVGKGNLPLREYLEELGKYYTGPVIIHGIEESDVDYALKYLQQ